MSYIDLTITSAPSTPATNHAELYVNSANKHLRTIDDTGTILDFGGGTVGTGTSGQNAVYNGTTSITSGATMSMNSTKITSLANGTASTDAAAFGQIKYLQAVQAIGLTNTSTTSSTFTAATNLSVSITPTSSSNRIKITINGPCNPTASTLHTTIFRNGTTELSGSTGGFWANTGDGTNRMFYMQFIDTPASTSSTTYQVYFKNENNSSSVNVGRTDLPTILIAEEIV